MRRTIIFTVVILVVAAGAYFLFQQRQAAQQQPQFEILRQAEVERGLIEATVSATGTIEPEALVSLTFGLAGTVQQVNVVRGQTVSAGDVLAALDTDELLLAVQQAQDAVNIQELTLQQRLNSQPSEATLASAQADIDAANANVQVAEANLASAEAAVLQAQAQRAILQAGPTSGAIAAAEAQVATAELQQKNAEDAYNATIRCVTVTLPNGEEQETCPGLGAPEEQARANLQNANAALEAARAQLADVLAGSRPADIQAANAAIASAEAGVLAAEGNIAAARANVARAEAAYARLLEGPTADEMAILEAQVASARTNLNLAQLRLEQATITTPISGQVANVLINNGEQATPGAPVITILNEGAFHINVNVDEIDIDQIAVGQPVAINLDALPGVQVSGVVAEVAPTPIGSGGIVTYLVTINITDPGVELRPGMSANASIVVEEVDDVLVVPNWAVRLDRETGAAFVNRLNSDGTVSEVQVETGLRNEQFSELKRGLNPGDQVVLTNEREGFSLFGG